MTGPSAGTSLRVALLSFPKSGRTWLKLMLKFCLEIMYIVININLCNKCLYNTLRHPFSASKLTSKLSL